jgi:hypothetical protein
MASDLQTLADYYASLLVLQYKDKPRARAMVRLFAKQFLADNLIDAVRTAFDVDTAAGAQLDIIGKYVGLPRNIGPASGAEFFGFFNYSETPPFSNPNGMQWSGDPSLNLTTPWLRYSDQTAQYTDLSDDSYRLCLKMKIAANTGNFSLEWLQTYLATFLPDTVFVRDNVDMTLTYYVAPSAPIDAVTLAKVIPRPTGVGVTILPNTVLPTVSFSAASVGFTYLGFYGTPASGFVNVHNFQSDLLTSVAGNMTAGYRLQWALSSTGEDIPDFGRFMTPAAGSFGQSTLSSRLNVFSVNRNALGTLYVQAIVTTGSSSVAASPFSSFSFNGALY